MGDLDYTREAFVRVVWVVYLANGDQHHFPSEEWARWFSDQHPASAVFHHTVHTFEGLHAAQVQGAAKEKP